MRKHFSLLCPVLALCVLGAGTALAGQADWTARMNEQNAVCDAQNRGEIPRNPDMCLPSLPPNGYNDSAPRR